MADQPTAKKSWDQLSPSEQSKRLKWNKAIHALEKLSPEKRAEIVRKEAERRGLL